MKKGKFITFEGVDRVGKTTQCGILKDYLEKQGINVISTREPGGTPYGDQLREMVKHGSLQSESEVLLLVAARVENIHSVIKPAIDRGDWVICDRFSDSTLAYQGGGRELDMEWIRQVVGNVPQMLTPDVTFYLPRPLNNHEIIGNDSFEKNGEIFYKRIEDVYQGLAKVNKKRIVTIETESKDRRRSENEVAKDIQQNLNERFFDHENGGR